MFVDLIILSFTFRHHAADYFQRLTRKMKIAETPLSTKAFQNVSQLI